MGIIDDEMKRLQEVVSGLEDRVRSLEQRQSGDSVSSEGVRMILIGPPGAGTSIGIDTCWDQGLELELLSCSLVLAKELR